MRPPSFQKLRGYQISGKQLILDNSSSCSFIARPVTEITENDKLEATALLETCGGVKVTVAKSAETKEKEILTVVGTVIRMVK